MITWIRVLLFTFLPLLCALVYRATDRSKPNPTKDAEATLAFLFGLGVAGSGVGGFFGHLFLSDAVALSIGWEAGSPFQLEMGFANLSLGVLGIVAVGRRDGFREATIIAVTVTGVGASVVHFIDIIETGNLAPGNTIQNIANLLRPALLIVALTWSRRTDRSTPQDESFGEWHRRMGPIVGVVTVIAATTLSVAYSVERTILMSVVGALVCIAVSGVAGVRAGRRNR